MRTCILSVPLTHALLVHDKANRRAHAHVQAVLGAMIELEHVHSCSALQV